jgi:hypothetical protein
MDNKEKIFEGGVDIILHRLDAAAKAVGEALETSLGDLAEKVAALVWFKFLLRLTLALFRSK